MGSERIRWAAKVPQAKLRRLYEADAAGMRDEELLDEVGSLLLERCRAVITVTSGRVTCPRCETEFAVPRAGDGPDEAGGCPTRGCGWQTTRAEWHASWRHRELLGTLAMPAIHEYCERYPKATLPSEQMQLIDAVIHAFHWDLKLGLPNRSTANNLVEGNHEQVVAFLDELTYGSASTEGLAERQEQWRATAAAMMRRRRPPR